MGATAVLVFVVASASGAAARQASADPVVEASSNPGILAPPDAIVDEAEGVVNFAVTLADEGTQTVTVGYQASNASAGAGGSCFTDYSPASGTLTFTPGEKSKNVPIAIRDCDDVEGLESLTLDLHTPVNGQIWRSSSRISIVDNDTEVAVPRLIVRDAVVDEKAQHAFVSVLMGGTAGQASNDTVTVDFTTAGGTADADSDYTTMSGTFSFSPGETVETVAIPITDDGAAEGVESFTLTLSNPDHASIADGNGVVTIGASEGPESTQPGILAPVDLVVGEGDGFVDLVVGLSAPSANLVTVTYANLNGSAGAGNSCFTDYSPANGALHFAPGETTKAVRVQINECSDPELIEAFTLNLSTEVNGVITRASGRISIIDNDTIEADPLIFVRDAVVDERDGFAYVSVLLGGPSGQASNSLVTVDYATANGTASADSDFTGVAGTLRFAPKETAKTVVVPITEDGATEGVESFALTLSNPNLATISDGSGRVVIGASDAAGNAQPGILVTPDLVVGEADGWVDLVVSLSQPGLNPVTVPYSGLNASAGAGNSCFTDYSPTGGTLHFAVGETTKAVRVQINDCADAELFEAFTLELGTPVNAAVTRSLGRISIVDNNTVVPTPVINVRDAVVDEKGGFAYVSVLLGGTGGQASNSSITVDYASANGSATGGDDFTAVGGTLTFAPGETAKTVIIPITDDATPESAESFTLGLSNPLLATIADGTGAVTIGASEGASSAQPGISAPTDVAVTESAGFVDLVVSLAQPGLNPVKVTYANQNVTAGAGNSCFTDYSPANGALHFAVGETTKVVRVQINDCVDVEPGETFNFNLSTPVNGAITDATGVTTICDNDGPVGLCSIAVTPPNPSIAVGANQQFTATGTNSDLSTVNLTTTAAWGSASTGVATISAGGLAHGLTPGTSTITATHSGVSGSTVLTVTGPAAPAAQTINFAALADRTFGTADFAVSATASSGLPVSFTASGNCTISGATVHITGAGSCTITASQPGNASFAPAPNVSRTFSIGKAGQTISFGPLANKRLGDPDFNVSASASSGLAVTFAGGGACTIRGARVHLVAVGSCTITASQAGDANYNAAAPVTRTFSITRRPVRCKVPRVIGKQLTAARAALTKAHCRTGKVTRVFSRTRRSGVVIGQSRRPGQLLPARTKVNLVVSRGRRR